MSRVMLSMLLVATCTFSFAETREEMVRNDRKKVESDGFWIYNDLPKAVSEARESGKPIIVVLRCIPCHECVKLDDDLVDKDPLLRPLLEQFIRVRQVSTNGLDLNLFQFDTDQSFAVFLLNADGTIYCRFGTRSHRTEWYGDVSIEGLAKAMQATLDLHKVYPAHKTSLAGKRGEPMEVSSPEKFPMLREKYSDQLNYSGEVAKSCIHCHQIGDAQRAWYRNAGKPIPEKVLFPFPHPKVAGFSLDPKELATVKSVEPNSPADHAGFQSGDEIKRLDGQPMLSVADVQWVLHNVDGKGGRVAAQVNRDGKPVDLQLALDDGWRQKGDLSWRSTSWGYRRMVTGGLVLEALSPEDRNERQLPADTMALRVKRVGQYGKHAAGKRAGFKQEDIIISFDGRDDLMSDTALLAYGVNARKAGEKVDVTVLRGNDRKTLKLPMQE